MAEAGYASLQKLHPALALQYSTPFTDQINLNKENAIIGACVAIVMMMQSYLASASSDSRLSTTEKLNKVKEAADLIRGAFETMDESVQTAPHCHFTSTIQHLGEFTTILFSIIIFDDAKMNYFS